MYRFLRPYVLGSTFLYEICTGCTVSLDPMSWGVPFSYEICTGCTVSLDPMSWGVPFLYEICTGCTVSIDPRLCVCILGVLPQDMETVEFFGSDLKCCYLTLEINSYMSVKPYFWPNSQQLTLNPVTSTLTQGHHTK